MCKVGKRVPAEISVKVSEVKHRGRIAESAGKAERGLRRGGQGRSGRFSEKSAKESPRRYLLLEPGEWVGSIFWIRGKSCENCAYTQGTEGSISQHQVEFSKDAVQFPCFHGIKTADILIITRIFREYGVRNQELKPKAFYF